MHFMYLFSSIPHESNLTKSFEFDSRFNLIRFNIDLKKRKKSVRTKSNRKKTKKKLKHIFISKFKAGTPEKRKKSVSTTPNRRKIKEMPTPTFRFEVQGRNAKKKKKKSVSMIYNQRKKKTKIYLPKFKLNPKKWNVSNEIEKKTLISQQIKSNYGCFQKVYRRRSLYHGKIPDFPDFSFLKASLRLSFAIIKIFLDFLVNTTAIALQEKLN